MLLTALTDEEFLRHAQAQHDPLLVSAIETELLRRFAGLIDKSADAETAAEVLAEYDVDIFKQGGIEDLRKVFAFQDAALSQDLDTPEALKKELERIRRFDSLMNDLTQPLKTLAELAPN